MGKPTIYDAEYFKRQGAIGGAVTGARRSAKQRQRAARKAARARWSKPTK